MKRALRLLLFATALCGCTHKSRAAEIVKALEEQGLSVEKGAARANEYGWEMNMELILDGQRGYLAVRFPSTSHAKDYCLDQNGVVVDYWCITARDPQNDPRWPKVQKIGGGLPF